MRMSLKKYIDEEFPKDQKDNILLTIKRWLGNVDLEDDMEKNPEYKTTIIGAINLMRHTAFEWINPIDTSADIGNRWHQIHLESRNKLSYGIRFSTSEPKMITLGFFYTLFDKKEQTLKSDYYFIRYEILDNFMFKEKRSKLQHSFSELLRIAVDHINRKILETLGRKRCDLFDYHEMKPLNLNVYPLVMEKLDFYITENHLKMNGYAVLLNDNEDEQSDAEDDGFYSHKKNEPRSYLNKTLKQGSRVWSFSPPK